jgi:uncharacterized protein YukE
MIDAQDRSETAWRRLDDAWYRAQEEWRGETADAFAAQFWSQFERDVAEYHAALNELVDEIETSLSVAESGE